MKRRHWLSIVLLCLLPLIGDRSGGGGAGLQLEYRFR